jgi:histidinol dehydrogenase
MRCERLQLSGKADELAERLRSLVPAPESVRDTVAEIIEAVRTGGDAAVLEYTRRFDGPVGGDQPLRIPQEELTRAAERLLHRTRNALGHAIANVSEVAGLAAPGPAVETRAATHTVKLSEVPVASAAVYVPGGRAPYPSTVVMGVVPALRAGVEQVVVCSPPGDDGEIDPVVLGACGLAGATAAYRMGGAQAIAALAYGTESVDRVDVIVGPGNLFVQEAKRQVFGQVGVDGFAGPSDLVLIAAGGADPATAALDLLAQAEHGPGTLVIGISNSPRLLEAIGAHVEPAPETGAVAALIEAGDLDAALALAEALAPEHLQLVGPEAEALADRVTTAGCLFVGASAGTAFGDYIVGSNHILPTDGTARFASALTPRQFTRTMSEVRIADAERLARDGAEIARAEGFEAHARSMEARIRQNRPDGE